MAETLNLSLDYLSQPNDMRRVKEEFAKPLFFNIFFINKEALKINAKEIDFTDEGWTRNPKKFCLDQYDQPELHPVIILVNEISSYFAFKRENLKNGKILAPPRTDIIRILNYKNN